MKTKLIILICSLGLLAGCASQSSPATCVLLKFPHAPSQQVVEQLANTQPIEDHQRIVAHFANGQKTFILSGIHTNEIAAAMADGATAKVIHGNSAAVNPIYGKK